MKLKRLPRSALLILGQSEERNLPEIANMSDRKAELERKKEKLRQIREEKERRKREREAEDAQASALRTASGEAGSAQAHHDINAQLKALGVTPVGDVLRKVFTKFHHVGYILPVICQLPRLHLQLYAYSD